MKQKLSKSTLSSHFWREKIIRTIIAILLLVALVFLWNWESSTQIETGDTNTTNPPQTAEQLDSSPPEAEVEEVPEEPAPPPFPYEIVLPADTAERATGGTPEQPSYTHALADGTTIVIYPEGSAAIAADFVWTYDVSADGYLQIASKTAQTCSSGAAGCTMGNGKYELFAKPATDNAQLIIHVVDSNVKARNNDQMAARYEEIIKTIRLLE